MEPVQPKTPKRTPPKINLDELDHILFQESCAPGVVDLFEAHQHASAGAILSYLRSRLGQKITEDDLRRIEEQATHAFTESVAIICRGTSFEDLAFRSKTRLIATKAVQERARYRSIEAEAMHQGAKVSNG